MTRKEELLELLSKAKYQLENVCRTEDEKEFVQKKINRYELELERIEDKDKKAQDAGEKKKDKEDIEDKKKKTTRKKPGRKTKKAKKSSKTDEVEDLSEPDIDINSIKDKTARKKSILEKVKSDTIE